MERETYETESRIEADHWWFVARRAMFLREIVRLGIAKEARILDVGTSTGTNLRMLRDADFTNITGLDFSPVAIEFCAEKGLGTVELGDVCAMPFPDACFDLILATDIVEHIDDDRKALSEILRVLKPGGNVLFTVPTFPALWGLQDDKSMHKRRYYKKQFNELVAGCGFNIDKSFYFNYILFVPIWLARQVIRLAKVEAANENHINTPFVNKVLLAIFRLDILTARYVRPPFGVSCMTLASRPP